MIAVERARMSIGFRPTCHNNSVHDLARASRIERGKPLDSEGISCSRFDVDRYVDVIVVTRMARRSPPRTEDTKIAALRRSGTLHPHPEAVRDEAFSADAEFFDRRDRLQVRYEMLRGHRVDGRPVTEVAAAFGVSRQAFYMTERAFQTHGLAALLPRPRGPKRAHKCTDAILDFVERWRAAHGAETETTAAEAVARRFGVTVHPRSLDRALARRKKKRRHVEEPSA